MKKIKLNNVNEGKFKGKFVALVDDDDYAYLNKFAWHIRILKGYILYAKTQVYLPSGKETTVYMHRFLMDAKDGQRVYFKDSNGLNNQRSNLELRNNSGNKQYPKKLKSFHPNIYFDCKQEKWYLKILFKTEQEAYKYGVRKKLISKL